MTLDDIDLFAPEIQEDWFPAYKTFRVTGQSTQCPAYKTLMVAGQGTQCPAYKTLRVAGQGRASYSV